jgi:hypothetical protein
MPEEDEVREEDIFGLPKLSTDSEIAISFTLFVLGNLLLFTVFYVNGLLISTSLLGFLMVWVSYFFVMESVRELEEKDHFLSRKLMKD